MNPRSELPPELSAGPFTYAAGRARGIGEGRLRGRDLERPFHGVRDILDQSDLRTRCLAYATKMPPNSFFSSATAALLMGAALPRRLETSPNLHLAVASPHRAFQGRGVVGHKVRLMGHDSWDYLGLRVSTPERAWCELGILLSVPELVAVGDHLVHWRTPLVSIEVLTEAISRYPDRRGKPRLRIAVSLLDIRAESPKESELRTILLLAGIDGIVANYEVVCAGSKYRLDLAIPALKVAIEYQGDYHREPAQWRADMTRRSRIESDDWRYLEFNANDLRDPREVVARVLATLRQRRVRHIDAPGAPEGRYDAPRGLGGGHGSARGACAAGPRR